VTGRSVRDLKTIQDWVIERNLRSVSGVADIVSFGGEVKTFEVSVNPHQLINYGITSLELYDAIAKSNINVGGDVHHEKFSGIRSPGNRFDKRSG